MMVSHQPEIEKTPQQFVETRLETEDVFGGRVRGPEVHSPGELWSHSSIALSTVMIWNKEKMNNSLTLQGIKNKKK